MSDIAISETQHGPADDRRYTFEPTYILRRLSELHLTFTPRPRWRRPTRRVLA